jgi:hypothetical protein
MKRFAYWVGASALVLALLFGLFLTADAIAEEHLPFQYIWGGFIAGLGILVLVLGWTAPAKLWGIGRLDTDLNPRILARASWAATAFGVLIFLGGVGYALTGHVEVVIAAFAVAGTYLVLARRRPSHGNDEPHGPAA